MQALSIIDTVEEEPAKTDDEEDDRDSVLLERPDRLPGES